MIGENDQLGLFEGRDGEDLMPSPACPTCHTRLDRIYADGFLGCETCYEVFADVVQQALISMHGTSRHTGKTL
ncbi:MAG: hypothetical protein P4L33_20065 [Capsulimonadaceae bacterium]|nr:hypothetical protein [Capsulimonadaceae bacterium]